jgi:hypothetical protein
VWKGRPENLQEFLFTYAQVDLEDFFNFVIGPSIGELENAPYGGFRFPIEARMAGRRFTRFSIDIAAGDVWFEPHEKIGLHDWLGFAGIPPAEIPIISKEQQFAEKLHSYSLVRDYPNSRLKDLIDMVILIKAGNMSPEKLLEITRKTFLRRSDTTFPPVFADPPPDWVKRYPALADTCAISESFGDAVALVRDYGISRGVIQKFKE